MLRSRDSVRHGLNEGQRDRLDVAYWLGDLNDGSVLGTAEKKQLGPFGRLFATRRNEATAIHCELNCWNQVSSQARLEHVPTRTGFQGGAASFTILLNGKENNPCGRLSFKNALGGFYAIDDRHGKIKHDDIREQLGGSADGRLPVGHSSNDFAMVRRQEIADIFKDLNVVVS